ncbi:MAG TPA: lysylphosphatidylglycerol synthase transmembrane domain-containing protein [Kiritimatiellia bacterium]|nr:lysylphosphatidylglycerol synthase transmembrane domain-containing protein [Kiritimatiellia bacterium]HRZ12274.1 lysylphosphatidylglycerol synthase transmembrane domain-containing protein [Kiritimatiellia bacterium]HSA17968.1 lysylphosphatidylglycerol synthase transmembrane domain-containing protein [Kiritimatiellia bacterium]
MSSRGQPLKRRTLLVKAAVSLVFFAVLFAFAGRQDLLAMLKRVDPLYFTLSFVIAAAQISTSCLKWRVLINLYGDRLGFGFLMRNYLIGYYFSNLLPSNIGGDVVRSYYAGRRIGNQTHAAISVFMERFTGSLYLLVLAIGMPLLKPGLYARPVVFVPAAGAAGLLLFFAALAFWGQGLLRFLNRLIERQALRAAGAPGRSLLGRGMKALLWFRAKSEKIAEKMALTMRLLKQNRRAALAVFGLTVLFYALTWVNVYLAYRTFGVEPDFIGIMSLLATAMLAGSIPITLGSLGIAEGAYVFYFRLVGMEPAATLAMGLFLRFKLLAVGLAGLVSYLTYPHERFDYERIQQQTETGSPGGDP